MNKQKLDIKSLTSELKSRSISSKVEKEKTEQDNKLYTNRSIKSRASDDPFLKLIKEVNSRKSFQMDRFIYVDNDIHEVFNKIKSHTKLKLSHLASYLLEQFILEHQDSIKSLLSNRQNKFLDS